MNFILRLLLSHHYNCSDPDIDGLFDRDENTKIIFVTIEVNLSDKDYILYELRSHN